MLKSPITLATLATAAFLAVPSSAAVAQQSDGARPDQSAQATDISASYRRYYRRSYGYPYYGSYYVGPGAYYSYGYYRPYRYRDWYWGPRAFRYGPWW